MEPGQTGYFKSAELVLRWLFYQYSNILAATNAAQPRLATLLRGSVCRSSRAFDLHKTSIPIVTYGATSYDVCTEQSPKTVPFWGGGVPRVVGGGAIEPLKRPLPIVAHLTKFGCSSTHGVSVVTYMQM